MEFTLIETGWVSLIPPILAIALALITKEVYSSLFIGVFSADFTGNRHSPAYENKNSQK